MGERLAALRLRVAEGNGTPSWVDADGGTVWGWSFGAVERTEIRLASRSAWSSVDEML